MAAELYERVAGERRRLREVRQALTAATGQGAKGDSTYVSFYIAIGDYFEAIMRRLHDQDIRLGELLDKRADLSTPENQQAMAELDDRLTGNQRHLKKMLAARDVLRSEGAAALDQFELAGGDYAAFIVANMGHHPGTADLAQAVFSADDWVYMADVNEADQELEQQLHTAVFTAWPHNSLEMPE
jgi:hypothetical protein